LREDPEREDAAEMRRTLVDLSMRMGRWQDGLAHLNRLLPKDPAQWTAEHSELALLVGQCQHAMGRYAEAADSYLSAMRLDPHQIDPYLYLVGLVTDRSDRIPLAEIQAAVEEAVEPSGDESPSGDTRIADARQLTERLLEAMVVQGQPAHDARLQRARYYIAEGDLTRAEADVNQALNLAGAEPPVLSVAADLALAQAGNAQQEGRKDDAQSQSEKARQFAQQGLAIQPPDPRFYLTLSRVEALDGDLLAAEQQLREGLKAYPAAREQADAAEHPRLDASAADLRWSLADLLITRAEQGGDGLEKARLDEARQLMGELVASGTDRSMTGFLDARILFVNHQWQAASLKFEQTRPDLADHSELLKRTDLALGTCYDRLGNPDAKIDVFRRALRDDPNWAYGRLQMAQALAQVGRVDDAISEYQAILGLPGVPFEIARLQFQKQLRLPAGQQRWDAVYAALSAEDTLRRNRGMEELVATDLLRAELLMRDSSQPADERFDQARTLLEDARDRHSDEPMVWTALANLELNRPGAEKPERIAAAGRVLQSAKEKLGDLLPLRVAAIQLAVQRGQEQAPAVLAELEQNIDSYQLDEQIQLWSALASAYSRLGEIGKGTDYYQRVMEAQPDDLQPRLVMVELATRAENMTALRPLLEEIRRIEGAGGPNGNYVAAVLQVQDILADEELRKDAEALAEACQAPQALLAEAARKRPYWAAVFRVQGRLHGLTGNGDEAYESYRQAIALGDRSTEPFSYAVQYLTQRRRLAEADQLLDILRQQNPSALSGDLFTEEGRKTLAGLAVQVASGLRLYGEALDYVPANSDNYRDKVVRALLRFSEYQGLSAARQQAQEGQAILTEVEQLYREAVQLAPDDPEPWVHFVTFYARSDRPEKAEEVIQEAQAKLPEKEGHLVAGGCYHMLGQLDKAEQQFESAVAAAPEDASRRMAALRFYAATNQVSKVQPHVQALLDPKYDASEETKATAQRMQALLISADGGYQDVRRGLDALRQWRGDQERSVADLRTEAAILAKSHVGPDRRALIGILEEIDRRGAITPGERFTLARLIERTGDETRAVDILRSLLLDQPDNEIILAYYTRALIRSDQWNEAESALQRLEGLLPGTFGVAALRADLMARRDPQLVNEAVALVRDAVKWEQASASEDTLSALLAQGQVDQALAALEAELAQHPDEQATAVVEQARRHLEDGNTAQAAQVLKGHAGSQRLKGALIRMNYTMAAEMVADWGELEVAADLVREFVKRTGQPAAELGAAQYLARAGQTEQALAVCEAARGIASPQAVAVTAVGVLREGQPTSDQINRVEAWIREGMKVKADSLFLVVQLANIKDLQGNYGESERLYQSVLTENNRAVVALNNLAWILALQAREVDKAKGLIDRAIELSGPAAALLDTRGKVHLAMGQAKQAAEDFRDSLADDPSPVTRFHLALALQKAGDKRGATEALRQAELDGFQPGDLHPLERPAYQSLSKFLAVNR
jgi:tetratricopeptide (TPR) repeat protein